VKLPRRKFLHLATAAAALPAVLRHAVALDYPTRPVRIIVGFAAGGSADIVARLTGQWLSERVGQQFIIENQTGAGTNIATEAVVNSPPDGYTLLLITAANFINATLYEKLKFNFIRDITPVAGLSREPAVMVVHSSSRPILFRSSSHTPRPIRVRSTLLRAASAPRPTFSASCSRC